MESQIMISKEAEKNKPDVQKATVGLSPDVMRMVRFLAADRGTSAYQVMSEAIEEVAAREFKKLGVKL